MRNGNVGILRDCAGILVYKLCASGHGVPPLKRAVFFLFNSRQHHTYSATPHGERRTFEYGSTSMRSGRAGSTPVGCVGVKQRCRLSGAGLGETAPEAGSLRETMHHPIRMQCIPWPNSAILAVFGEARAVR